VPGDELVLYDLHGHRLREIDHLTCPPDTLSPQRIPAVRAGVNRMRHDPCGVLPPSSGIVLRRPRHPCFLRRSSFVRAHERGHRRFLFLEDAQTLTQPAQLRAQRCILCAYCRILGTQRLDVLLHHHGLSYHLTFVYTKSGQLRGALYLTVQIF